MQTQGFSGEGTQEMILRKIESGSESPELLAQEMLNRGGEDVQKLQSQIDDLIESMAWEPDNEQAVLQLKMIKEELANAYSDLNADLSNIDIGWDQVQESVTDELKEEAKEEVVDNEFNMESFEEHVDDLFGAGNFDFSLFQTLKQEANASKEAQEALQEALKERVGIKFTKLLLESSEYSNKLQNLSLSLEGALGEDGPAIMSEKNILALIAVNELLGDEVKSLLRSFDLRKYADGIVYQSNNDVIQVMSDELDFETGDFVNLRIDVGMDANYEYEEIDQMTGEKELKSEPAMIYREFKQTQEVGKDGTMGVKKSVHHELLRVPDVLQGNGIAAKISKESLANYDLMGLDEITLNASLERGGYAWAVYGYGWDEDMMSLEGFKESHVEAVVADFDQNEFIDQLKIKDPSLTENELKNKMKEKKKALSSSARNEATKLFAKMQNNEKLEYLIKRIDKMISESRNEFVRIAKEAGLSDDEIAPIISQYKEMQDHPESVTPQRLAAIGREGPMFRIGENGSWMTEKAFLEAVKNGEDKEVPQMKGRFHAGKLGLSQTYWYGKMELKKDSKQRGVNRKIFEDVLNRSTK